MHNNKIQICSRFAKVSFCLLIFILCVVYLIGCARIAAPVKPHCTESRAAFDIGSATMKMKTAKVDKCRQINIGTLHKKEVKVPFAENTRDHLLSSDIQDKGIELLKALKQEALASGAQKFAGVATAAFRQAQNASQFLTEIKVKTGITVKLISQDEEAVLGYQAAIANAKGRSRNIVVWDIGGNSMQIIMQTENQGHIVYRGYIASISFKNQIIEKVLRKSVDRITSPNPIGKQNLAAALEIAVNAAADVPDDIKNYIRQKGIIVVGIGGVHNQSVRKQVRNDDTYHRDDLMNALNDKLDLMDTQIGGHYADTEVSNLILVLGFMKKLHIEKVHLADVNLADGILIAPTFW
jgi:exopolyphosphatase/guanosine-5'-triphosphate,3'-diphosphate pyrophosphatase